MGHSFFDPFFAYTTNLDVDQAVDGAFGRYRSKMLKIGHTDLYKQYERLREA